MGAADLNLRQYLIENTRLRVHLGLLPKGYNYVGAEDYLLDRGSPFESEALTEDELRVVQEAVAATGIKRFQTGQCFYNAQMLAAMDASNQLTYYEGYAQGTVPLPLLHGWVVIHDKVVDLTWRTMQRRKTGVFKDRILGSFPEGWAYYGAHFSSETVRTRIHRMKATCSFLEDYSNDFSLFQEPRLRSITELIGR
jgi:hypothetical protein